MPDLGPGAEGQEDEDAGEEEAGDEHPAVMSMGGAAPEVSFWKASS